MAKSRIIFLATFTSLCSIFYAQDSLRLRHELGFNAVSLLQQIRVFTVTPGQQLPYDFFYNFYFNDRFGIRVGAGLLSTASLTEIDGQDEPREHKDQKMNFRVGVTYNFVDTKRFTFNFFADGLFLRSGNETINTTTVQVFPNPVGTRTVKISESTVGTGGQVGVGLKWNMTRHLSLYTEMPLSFVNYVTEVEDKIQETGLPDLNDRSVSTTTGIKFDLPLTLYLVLRF